VEAAVTAQVLHGDCLELMRDMPDASVDLIVTDPPYFKVKGEAWDHQWAKPAQFLAWLDKVLEQLQRILKTSGSLYLFASPQMAARVELLIAERFNVLNSIRWVKLGENIERRHVAQVVEKGLARSYLPSWEAAVFAEHRGTEGYDSPCDRLWGELSEPVRDWMLSAWRASGLSRAAVDAACGTKNVAQYWFSQRGFQLPTEEKYRLLQQLAPWAFSRPYESLREECDRLGLEYARRRRPFAITANAPYADLWTFKPVAPYPGKHSCEKPSAMLEHIIATSSRPGAVVFDAFTGTGSTGMAAVKLGRQFIGCELSQAYVETARARISRATFKPEALPRVDIERQASRPAPMNLDLFGMEAA
jgi:site-specific DNA-methyltransferase (adenine-specific)